jgi:3-oxoacyl-[acyl-carrier-protein] synthase II
MSTEDERRVVVTGLGAVTALGQDVQTIWSSLLAGRSGIGPIASFDASSLACRIAAEVRDYAPPPRLDADHASRVGRASLFAVDAALQAIADAELLLTPENASQVGVVMGTALGRAGGNAPADLSSEVRAALEAAGPSLTLSAGGACGAMAIGLGAAMIRSGEAMVAVCGGADAPLTLETLSAFDEQGLLSHGNDDPAGACRPFDARRDGFVLGEGAAALVLERSDVAEGRGARIYAEIAGYSATSQRGDDARLSPIDAGRAMQRALMQEPILQNEIDYYCAHAPGSFEADRLETQAIERLFGQSAAAKLTISSVKPMTGHLLAASSALEAIVCIKALEAQTVPPTINLGEADPECDLDYVPNEPRQERLSYAMSYAFGLGGRHACLIFGKPRV